MNMAPKKSAPAEAPKRRGRPPGSKNKSTLEKAAKAPKAAKAAPKKLGRPPKAAAPKAVKSEAVRSAANGGHIPKERYAKDPKSVATRLKDKANKALAQAGNAVVRAETAGNDSPAVEKLRTAMGHFEAAKKALA